MSSELFNATGADMISLLAVAVSFKIASALLAVLSKIKLPPAIVK